MTKVLRLGTRGSRLAMTQSQHVADAIGRQTDFQVELVVISTRGDRIQDKPLPEIGGKGLFTLELEEALQDGSIDMAVHSLKDLPTEDPEGLALGAIPKRADPRDAIVGCSIDALSQGAKVGSGSLRRRTQLLAIRPDLDLQDIRGNVPTRLSKLDRGDFTATILAMAGLNRLGIDRQDVFPISIEEMVPAVGQGALGVQCRALDPVVCPVLSQINDPQSQVCVEGERAFLAALGGGCNVPAGCHIVPSGDQFRVRAVVASGDGGLNRFEAVGGVPVELGLSAARAFQ